MEETLKITVHIPAPGSALAAAVEPGSVVMPIGNPRQDGVRAVCWESRGFAERVPSTFADRAERAYARSRDHQNDLRKLVDGSDIRPIGRLDTLTGTVALDSEQDAAALAAWLGTARLDAMELSTTRRVVVQMYRELVRDHSELLPQPEQTKRSGHATGTNNTGGRGAWHTSWTAPESRTGTTTRSHSSGTRPATRSSPASQHIASQSPTQPGSTVGLGGVCPVVKQE